MTIYILERLEDLEWIQIWSGTDPFEADTRRKDAHTADPNHEYRMRRS